MFGMPKVYHSIQGQKTIKRHFPTKYVNYAINFSLWGREEKKPCG